MRYRTLCMILVALGQALPAAAGAPVPARADPKVIAPEPQTGFALGFSVRTGASYEPNYYGSYKNDIVPDLAVRIYYLRLPGGREFGLKESRYKHQGLGLLSKVRYVPSRKARNSPELVGLNTVGDSVEVGLGLGYNDRMLESFADVRYGVMGHASWVGEIGANLLMFLSDAVTMRFGPRAIWGSDKYTSTYFGVSPTEAAAGGNRLQPFDAGAGLVSAGLELDVHYALDDLWGVEAAIAWNRLFDDAAQSPITSQGDQDQLSLRLGLTRRFNLQF